MNLKHVTLLLLSFVLLLSSCKKDKPTCGDGNVDVGEECDGGANCNTDCTNMAPITLTQAILDGSTSLVVSLTGQQNGQDFAHNGSGISSDSTTRDIFSTASSVSATPAGTIVTKHTYLNNPDGSKGALQVTFAMIKHLEGWWPAGNDWEYVMMPNDGTIDYSVTPNGDLSKAAAVGQLDSCDGCHALADGGDRLFIND